MQKHFLFIVPMFPKNEEEDHIMPFITQFTKQFAYQKNVKIDIISLLFPIGNSYAVNEQITVYPMGSGYLRTYKFIPFYIKAIRKAIQLNRENKYTGILSFWYRECALIGKFTSLLIRKKQIVWMLGQDVKKDNKFIPFLRIKKQNIVMLSAQQRDLFYKNHGIYIDKIANIAIDRALFPELNKNIRTIDVLGVGNLGAVKNYSFFIDIVAELKTEFPDIKVAICGDGEEREKLLQKIEHLQLQDTIILKGALSHQETLLQMNNSKVFLHTAIAEGAGGVLHEALYSGCSVVSTIAIEDTENLDCFYYSQNKSEIAKKIAYYLKTNIPHPRVEKFKMEDSVNLLFDLLH
jgi:glycosyltransferase involved in cell wall biosynthesis